MSLSIEELPPDFDILQHILTSSNDAKRADDNFIKKLSHVPNMKEAGKYVQNINSNLKKINGEWKIRVKREKIPRGTRWNR